MPTHVPRTPPAQIMEETNLVKDLANLKHSRFDGSFNSGSTVSSFKDADEQKIKQSPYLVLSPTGSSNESLNPAHGNVLNKWQVFENPRAVLGGSDEQVRRAMLAEYAQFAGLGERRTVRKRQSRLYCC